MESITIKKEPMDWLDGELDSIDSKYVDFLQETSTIIKVEHIKEEPSTSDSIDSTYNCDILEPVYKVELEATGLQLDEFLKVTEVNKIKKEEICEDNLKKESTNTESTDQITLVTQLIEDALIKKISNPIILNKKIKKLAPVQSTSLLDKDDKFELTVKKGDKKFFTNLKTYKSHKLCPFKAAEYLCEICSKPFPNIVSLKDHEESHDVIKAYQCQECSFCSSVLKSYTKHIQVHSKGKRLFKCAHCEYTTTVLRQFNMHKFAHGGNKTFKCNDCPYVTKSYDDMEDHKVFHSQETFKCDECEFTSRRLYYLNMHKLIHNGPKVNKCGLCDYSGSHPRYLRLHKKLNSH